jgi:hypothetical protein
MSNVQDQSSSAEATKKDKGGELYKKSTKLNFGNTITFWLIVALSVVRTVAPNFIPGWLSTIQIIGIILNIALWIVNDYGFLYAAEKERRKFAIQNGFGVELTDYTTSDYYSNQMLPSENRYFINIYESNYYSKDISGKMIPFALIKTILALGVWALTIWMSHDPGLVLVAAETVFSSSIMMKTAALIAYWYHIGKLLDIPYRIYITEGKIGTAQRAMLFDYAVEYEAIKAHFKVPLDSKIYLKNKDRLEKEWAELEKRINH